MVNELMSSEESAEDDDGEFIVVHPLPWRSKYVSKKFSQIDRYNIQYKSAQAKRQMKPRHLGSDSARMLLLTAHYLSLHLQLTVAATKPHAHACCV